MSDERAVSDAARTPNARSSLARTGVYGFLCTDCDHPAHAHRLSGDWRVGRRIYVCRCGCEKPEHADYAGLNRFQWQTWLDQHPEWTADA